MRHALRHKKLSFKIGIEAMPTLPKELRYLLVVLGKSSYEEQVPNGEEVITGATDDMDEYCVKAIGRIESLLKEFKSSSEPSIRVFPVIVTNALSALHAEIQGGAEVAEKGLFGDDQKDLMTYWGSVFDCDMYREKSENDEVAAASASSENATPSDAAPQAEAGKSSTIDFDDPIYKRVKACYDAKFDPNNPACHVKSPICGTNMRPNISFTRWTDESGHVLPGCTLTLQPVWNAAGRLCPFCGRHRIYTGPFAARLCPPAFCNWCGHVVKPPLASEWHAKSRPPAAKAKAKASASK